MELNVTYNAQTSLSPGWLKKFPKPNKIFRARPTLDIARKDSRCQINYYSYRKKQCKTEFVFLMLANL